MASTSRYKNTKLINSKYKATTTFPEIDFTTIKTISIRTTTEDRLDTLAAKYLGAGQYWWIIAYMNGLDWAWDFEPGQILILPSNINDILSQF